MPEAVHELTFTSEVAGWINGILEKRPSLPFSHAKIEERARGKRTRKDLTLYDRDGKVALNGEVKMPETGLSPYADELIADAAEKAGQVGARYFFTWNVNHFVLWDPAKITLPWHQRQSLEYRWFHLVHSREIEAPSVVAKLRTEYLPKLLEDVAALYRDETLFGALPPDRRFIQMLESFLERPVLLTEFEVFHRYHSNRAFHKDLNEWMVKRQGWTVPTKEPDLSDTLERASKLSCYVLSNKLIFYESLRGRFPLKALRVPKTVETVDQMYGWLTRHFEHAQKVTADYETLFWPDYGAKVPLLAPGAIDAWRAVIEQIGLFNLSKLNYDVLGPIFERLIDPEAKRRWGQYYTQPTIVDVINAFTIRHADAVVLDPACGSGTFLVRAYARKRWLDNQLDHPTLLAQLYGTDISGYAVHLSALGLASRELIEADNYPRLDRKDFFDVAPESKFMTLPQVARGITTSGLGSKQLTVKIQRIDAGVGNPPYIRQEHIVRKAAYEEGVERDAPDFNFSGRSDIYVYFWPHLATFLKPDGPSYLGLLTSSSWLDVEYGFRLQEWFLRNFKILAILESACEPWFEAARVATAVTIVQSCTDETQRMQNPVRFVQLRVPLAQLLENDGTEDGRQRAAERVRDLILSAGNDSRTGQYRILVRTQRELWDEGCRLRSVLERAETRDEAPQRTKKQPPLSASAHRDPYGGGKWGVYLRAPDLFFEIMEKYGKAFVPLGEIADVRRGVTSGCDDFFFPQDHTAEALKTEPIPDNFKQRYGVPRSQVESGKVKIVKAGDGSDWPIEAEYLEPEVHSLMEIDSVVVKQEKLKRLILLLDKPKSDLKGSFVLAYIKYGEKEALGGDTPVAERSTCASRLLWYDLSGATRGDAFWPGLQKYRHMVAANTQNLICNCDLFGIAAKKGTSPFLLGAILNSTLAAFLKHFYGRFAGMEGTLKTQVVDVVMLPVPDFRGADGAARERLEKALQNLAKRQIGYLLEDQLLEMVPLEKLAALEATPPTPPRELRQPDRQELDRAVLALIGVPQGEIPELLDRLYRETALVYRRGRILDIRTAANKRKQRKTEGVTPNEIATAVWESLPQGLVRPYPDAWLQPSENQDSYSLPDGKLRLVQDMFHQPRLKSKFGEVEFRHLQQAQLGLALYEAGWRGAVTLPADSARCRALLADWNAYVSHLRATLQDEVSQRTPDEKKAAATLNLLLKRAFLTP